MKSFRHIILLLILFHTIITQSCIKEDSDLLPDGNMVGYVYTFSEFVELLEDHSGVFITTRSKSAYYQTITDRNGRFEFKNLPAGTYELNFVKEGFSILKHFGVKHLGGEPTILGMRFDYNYGSDPYFLREIPTTLIQSLYIRKDSVFCEFDFKKPPPEALFIELSFSLTDNFSLGSADFTTGAKVIRFGSVYKGKLSYTFSPFKTGDKVYFRGQVDPYSVGGVKILNNRIVSGIQYYFDYENNKTIYPALGKESDQYSFIY